MATITPEGKIEVDKNVDLAASPLSSKKVLGETGGPEGESEPCLNPKNNRMTWTKQTSGGSFGKGSFGIKTSIKAPLMSAGKPWYRARSMGSGASVQDETSPTPNKHRPFGKQKSQSIVIKANDMWQEAMDMKSTGQVHDDLYKITNISDLVQSASQQRDTVTSNLSQWFLVHPHSQFRMAWDCTTIILLAYVAVFTPFQICFLGEKHIYFHPSTGEVMIKDWFPFFVVDRIVDLLFVIDIFINFRSAYVNERGHVLFHQDEVCYNYTRGWFMLDVLSVLPWDLLANVTNFGGESETSTHLRFPRLLKLVKLMKLLKILKASRVVKRVEQNVDIKYGVVRLVKFVCMTFIMGHWMACIFRLMSSLATEDMKSCQDDPETGEMIPLHTSSTWVDTLYCSRSCTCDKLLTVERTLSHHSVDEWRGIVNGTTESLFMPTCCADYEVYIVAAYWSIMTLTTIGYGDIGPNNVWEYVYVILSMMIGAAFFSFVLGSCVSLVEGLDAIGIQFQEQLDGINDYMEVCSVPVAMRRRVRNYLWNYKELQGRKNEAEILSSMSPGIKQELLLWNYGRILRKVVHFVGAPDIFIAQFAELANQNLIGPRDTISNHQQHGDGFYVLTKGEVIFLRPAIDNARLHQTGRAKDIGHWNDRLLIFDSPSDHTVLAVTFVETYTFPGAPVRELLRKFPDGYRRCKKNVMRMLWAMYLVPLARKQALEVYKEHHSAKEMEKMNQYRERHQGDLPPLRALMTKEEKEELSRMREKLRKDLEEAERRVRFEVAEEMRREMAESHLHRGRLLGEKLFMKSPSGRNMISQSGRHQHAIVSDVDEDDDQPSNSMPGTHESEAGVAGAGPGAGAQGEHDPARGAKKHVRLEEPPKVKHGGALEPIGGAKGLGS